MKAKEADTNSFDMLSQHNEDKSSREMEKSMNTFEYRVAGIDGDYANLERIDAPEEGYKPVARALLPPEIKEGTRLLYEMLQYRILDD